LAELIPPFAAGDTVRWRRAWKGHEADILTVTECRFVPGPQGAARWFVDYIYPAGDGGTSNADKLYLVQRRPIMHVILELVTLAGLKPNSVAIAAGSLPEAESLVRNLVKENPDKLYGIFRLWEYGQTDSPPVRFTKV
jgi:hypothetical protein